MNTKDFYCQTGDSYCNELKENSYWNSPSLFNSDLINFESEMKNTLLGKTMEEFERSMLVQTKKFEEMRRQIEDDQLEKEKIIKTQHIPSVLKNDQCSLDDIWSRVHTILTQSSSDDGFKKKISMKIMNPELYQLILSQGIATWMMTLDESHYLYLSRLLYSELADWISKIWRFQSNSCTFHYDRYEGVLRACKAALCEQYPKYVTDGYNALYSKPPVIYINDAINSSIIDFLKLNLGLSHQSFEIVENKFRNKGNEKMNTDALEKTIISNISAGMMPLLVYCFAGYPNTGGFDDLYKISELSRKYKIWIHIEGLKLNQLALVNIPVQMNDIRCRVKSLTLDIGCCLGIPTSPYVTLISSALSDDILHTIGFGDYPFNSTRMLSTIFPIWMGMQIMGYDGIVKKIETKIKLGKELNRKLKKVKFIKYLHEKRKKVTENSVTEKKSTVKNVLDTIWSMILADNQSPLVSIFRFEPDTDNISKINNENESENSYSTEIDDTELQPYLDSLNHWLRNAMDATYPMLNIQSINIASEGSYLRICIHENVNSDNITNEDIVSFTTTLKEKTTFLEATMKLKYEFYKMILDFPTLFYFNSPSWMGVGSIVYVSECYQSQFTDLFPDKKIDVYDNAFNDFLNNNLIFNDINKSMAVELSSEDEAFSVGYFNDGTSSTKSSFELYYIKFGLITDSDILEKLIQAAVDKGIILEKRIKDFESYTTVLKNGIVKVTKDLEEEYMEKLIKEGPLRQVPLINDLLNWISPVEKMDTHGRSLNLSSGEIKMTDDTYKYKMQLPSNL